MRVVAFVPIKLNNQRLPGKNTRLLNGKPLCSYLFDSLSGIDSIGEKYVYCSDERIVPYIPEGLTFLRRDASLDGFEVKGLDIIEAFIRDVDADVYVLCHVTQPFTRASTLVRGLEMVLSGEYDSAFSAIKLQDYLWGEGRPLNYDPGDIPRSQDLEPVYMETGSFFIFRREVFTELGRRIGVNPYVCEVDRFEGVDIDTQEDFEYAEAVARYLAAKDIDKRGAGE